MTHALKMAIMLLPLGLIMGVAGLKGMREHDRFLTEGVWTQAVVIDKRTERDILGEWTNVIEYRYYAGDDWMQMVDDWDDSENRHLASTPVGASVDIVYLVSEPEWHRFESRMKDDDSWILLALGPVAFLAGFVYLLWWAFREN
ncbi:MAG: hypothetical protein QF893_02825 [Alphaproteobacteria bacterium]|jgi:hypothetical protein|nr:hypothetical protein [Alphaproteobacteria bacterium]